MRESCPLSEHMRQSVVEDESLRLPDGKDKDNGQSEGCKRGVYLLDLEAWKFMLSRL